MTTRKFSILLISLILAALVSVPAYAQSPSQMRIRVGWYQDGMLHIGDSSALRKLGFAYEVYQKISDYTGWEYEYVYGSRQQLMALMDAGKVDMLADTLSDSAPDARLYHLPGNVCIRIGGCSDSVSHAMGFALSRIQHDYPDFFQNLGHKYFSDSDKCVRLSKSEMDWVRRHGEIRIGYSSDYMPFCATAADGSITGVLSDIMTNWVDALEMHGKLRVTFVPFPHNDYEAMLASLNRGELDAMFPMIDNLWYSEDKSLVTSRTIVSSSVVAVYKPPFESGMLNSIATATSAMQYIFTREYFPDSEMHLCATRDECLQHVLDGEVGCTLFNATRAQELQYHDKFSKLEFMPLGITADYGFAVRKGNADLLGIINKGLLRIDKGDITTRFYSYSRQMSGYNFRNFMKEYGRLVALVMTTLSVLVILVLVRIIRRKERNMREKEALNLRLEEANRVAEQANAAKTRFLFNMSHDIRTPMNAIMGYTNLLRKYRDDSAKFDDYVGKIQSSSDFLLSLINDVLEMARIESGSETIEEAPHRFGSILHEIMDVYQELFRCKGIDFRFDGEVRDVYFYADVVKLKEICLNLISNAYKYTNKGGSVVFSVRELPCEREGFLKVETKVSDTGIGMDGNYLSKIFDPFTRAKTVTESGIQGTGLGMPIVKRLVELMGGTIEVESAPGKGTTFTLVISHRLADDADVAEGAHNVCGDLGPLAGKRLLLAEDNDLNAEIAMEILSDMGLEVERAVDGKVCVDMLLKHPVNYYDAILMDVQMPNMDGYRTAEAIRNMDNCRRDIPIIAMTANAFDEDRRNALAAGMNAHLAKPIEMDKLIETLLKLV